MAHWESLNPSWRPYARDIVNFNHDFRYYPTYLRWDPLCLMRGAHQHDSAAGLRDPSPVTKTRAVKIAAGSNSGLHRRGAAASSTSHVGIADPGTEFSMGTHASRDARTNSSERDVEERPWAVVFFGPGPQVGSRMRRRANVRL